VRNTVCKLRVIKTKFDVVSDKLNVHKKEASPLNAVALSPQVNYTDRATAAVGEVVPTFAGGGCYVVSATDSHGR
jgi:hypothetical protein